MNTTLRAPTKDEVFNAGYLIDIRHYRNHKIAYKDSRSGKLIVHTVQHVKEFVNPPIANTDIVLLFELLAKGGQTVIEVVDPVTKETFVAVSKCRDDENYDKREGVKRCLEQIGGMMMLRDDQDGFNNRLPKECGGFSYGERLNRVNDCEC